MFKKPPRYRSYLLTVGEERNLDPDQQVAWRFSVEDARTGRRRGFCRVGDAGGGPAARDGGGSGQRAKSCDGVGGPDEPDRSRRRWLSLGQQSERR